MNEVWDEWVPQATRPRATVEPSWPIPDYLIEVVVTAALN
jgi:enamine deaminase RidA (YjgF/YER057c/UK114 family)